MSGASQQLQELTILLFQMQLARFQIQIHSALSSQASLKALFMAGYAI